MNLVEKEISKQNLKMLKTFNYVLVFGHQINKN